MKNTIVLVFLVSGLLATTSCQKDDASPGPPKTITINKIEVTRFPFTDDGADWDVLGDADIFPTLSLGNTLLWKSPTNIKNANPNSDHTFNPSPAIELNKPSSEYTIRLYDYDDFDADDYMGGINFTPYHGGEGYPSRLILDFGGDLAFKLHVSYGW